MEVRVTDHTGGSGEWDIQPAVTEHDRINFAMRVRLTIKKQKMEKLLRGEKIQVSSGVMSATKERCMA